LGFRVIGVQVHRFLVGFSGFFVLVHFTITASNSLVGGWVNGFSSKSFFIFSYRIFVEAQLLVGSSQFKVSKKVLRVCLNRPFVLINLSNICLRRDYQTKGAEKNDQREVLYWQ
jgi:hypothetical protein